MGTLANIKVEPMTVTWGASDVGFTDGDIEISTEEQAVDITAHQEGTRVMDAIRTGNSVELSIVLKETTVAQVKTILTAGGGTNTPGGGTEVVGWGASQRFSGQLADALKLVLHPVVLSGSDKSRDFAFWKAYPMLETITLSGENPMLVSVTFKIFPDTSKPSGVDMFVQGDHSQFV